MLVLKVRKRYFIESLWVIKSAPKQNGFFMHVFTRTRTRTRTRLNTTFKNIQIRFSKICRIQIVWIHISKIRLAKGQIRSCYPTNKILCSRAKELFCKKIQRNFAASYSMFKNYSVIPNDGQWCLSWQPIDKHNLCCRKVARLQVSLAQGVDGSEWCRDPVVVPHR